MVVAEAAMVAAEVVKETVEGVEAAETADYKKAWQK